MTSLNRSRRANKLWLPFLRADLHVLSVIAFVFAAVIVYLLYSPITLGEPPTHHVYRVYPCANGDIAVSQDETGRFVMYQVLDKEAVPVGHFERRQDALAASVRWCSR